MAGSTVISEILLRNDSVGLVISMMNTDRVSEPESENVL